MGIYTGRCLYCGLIVDITADKTFGYGGDKDDEIFDKYGSYPPKDGIVLSRCPNCKGFYVFRIFGFDDDPDGWEVELVYPRSRRISLPEEIPTAYRKDYEEALSIANFSPKGSAALLRRLLQKIIREAFGIRKYKLEDEIAEFIRIKDIPGFLKKSVDGVRAVGNFAAHPIKSENTGEIVEVEPGEVDWLIETVEGLLDFAFVQPDKLEKRRTALNKKLGDLGKPPIK